MISADEEEIFGQNFLNIRSKIRFEAVAYCFLGYLTEKIHKIQNCLKSH